MRLWPAMLSLCLVACSHPAEDLVESADLLSFQQEYMRAAKTYEAALLELPSDLDEDTLLLRGDILLKLGRIQQNHLNNAEGALRSYQSVANLVSTSEQAYEARLLAARLLHDRVGDHKAAARELERLLTAQPRRSGDLSLRLEIAKLEFRAGDHAKAVEHANAAAQAEDSGLRVEALNLIATSSHVREKLDAALAAYQRLLEEEIDIETRNRVTFELARAYDKMGDLKKARELYGEAQAGAPNPDWIAERLKKIDEMEDAHKKEKKAPARRASRPRSVGIKVVKRAPKPTAPEPSIDPTEEPVEDVPIDAIETSTN